MKTIIPHSAGARVAPFAERRQAPFDAHRVRVPRPVERGLRAPLRARWSIDPASGRLACRWVSDDEVPDSPHRRDRSPVSDASDRTACDRFAA
ncbi:hypothetical protein [Methylobacterium radiotolerans]|jgi:hypothetical protein|uniref:hypothetical protein n=1 Tax=Methylobacterium TaxID=407 RepID=UPI0005B7CCAF|nr:MULTISPECIES: hypothetical protein [Methylobacterium]KIU27129.1 hypothetical protein SR39_30825 [Methylobacterium radiotolerans]MCX4196093.1 hypothetical protein [Methylobacterium organophilum]MDE3750296.1 hypothetical protein [Methylobacterium radiotolerans]UIY45054.1 hypothetical protein LZ599_29695 [Methylobacterium radiotolerans]GEN01686.1 hypothetical protein MRA01_62250 [Methylobacterium radiotolerans]